MLRTTPRTCQRRLKFDPTSARRQRQGAPTPAAGQLLAVAERREGGREIFGDVGREPVRLPGVGGSGLDESIAGISAGRRPAREDGEWRPGTYRP